MHPHSDATTLPAPAPPLTSGWVMDLGWRYDLQVRLVDALLFRGHLRRIPGRALELAGLQSGERVLDVGCGTGDLALLARGRVGRGGTVAAIDPGARQIARARRKAAARGVAVEFGVGVAERLDFASGGFDAVLSTLMLHHLPDEVKREALAEMLRVLRPGGRAVIVDFNRPPERNGTRRTFGAGMLGMQDCPVLLWDAGFEEITSGSVYLPRVPGVHGAGYAVARRPRGS